MKMTAAVLIATCGLVVAAHAATPTSAEPTKATQSAYEQDMRRATTSDGLSKADLAWHALNTYGWDCDEVIKKEPPTKDGYYVITCSSGKKLRVYSRPQQHPKITNIDGSYN
ncbi:hypothetical protein [Ralstonia pseudosolanacearum]|uniref:hypothetical protein n=1 Tax=Ralstonia pseudosolanacearum TaxID=1310165 RepID=UPI003CEDEEEF